MTRLAWGAIGERFFETGIDRGVLFVAGADGVAWNGLVSVSESQVGGETSQHYVDGIMYLNRATYTDFEATIEAFTYPDEFLECDGTNEIHYGLSVTGQRRKAFDLSYRTRVGNDVEGVDHAYKIHFIYNATATPSDHPSSTIGDSVDPDNFSWKITAKPPDILNHKPTAHLFADSRKAPPGLMQELENILYGTEDTAPRMPYPEELIFLFSTFGSSVFDAGTPNEPYFITFDGGNPPTEPQTSTIDGGTP